jgi:hypothetical protein
VAPTASPGGPFAQLIGETGQFAAKRRGALEKDVRFAPVARTINGLRDFCGHQDGDARARAAFT